MPIKRLKILSHNVFWFQGASFLTDKPGEPVTEILSSLAELYDTLRPDIICLQEIQSEITFHLVAAELGMAGAYCPGATFVQYGGAAFWKYRGTCVVDSQSSAEVPQRMWQIIEVPVGDAEKLNVCNIHLPSARQLGQEASVKQRLKEISNVLRQDACPMVVVGDFNVIRIRM